MQTIQRTIKRASGETTVRYKKGPYLTAGFECGRPLVITLYAGHVQIRQHGTRQKLTLPYESIYYHAAVAEDRLRRRERDKSRRSRRKGR